MAKADPAKAADIERRIREAAAQGREIPAFRPQIGDLMTLFGAGRSTVGDWFTEGVRIGGRRIVIRYWLSTGGYRLAHPADVLEILEETRKLRSADEPDGVTPIPAGVCPTCGQKLPDAERGHGDDEGPSPV